MPSLPPGVGVAVSLSLGVWVCVSPAANGSLSPCASPGLLGVCLGACISLPGCVGVGPHLSTCVRHSSRQGATSRPFSRGGEGGKVTRTDRARAPRPSPRAQAALAVGGLRSDPNARAAGPSPRAAGPSPRPALRGAGAPLTSRPHRISSGTPGRSVRGQWEKSEEGRGASGQETWAARRGSVCGCPRPARREQHGDGPGRGPGKAGGT